MFVKIGGLPAHVLLVHVVVVLLPLASLMLMLGMLWPRARRRFGPLTMIAAGVGLVLVPVTTHAGEWLQDRLPRSTAIERHADLGDQLLPWAAGLFVLAALTWWVGRRREFVWRAREAQQLPVATQLPSSGDTATLVRPSSVATRRAAPVWVTAVLTALSIMLAGGTTIMLYRIGDSGARAVWNGVADLPAR